MKKLATTLLLLIGLITNAQHKQPNVLLILADDLGINALNCYGNELVETPNIDKLFHSGMHFTNGYSNDPTCAPSRAAIMTGQTAPRTNIYRVVDRHKISKNADDMLAHMKYLPPESNHLYSNNNGLSPETFNMAKAFKQSGYNTAAYGKWHLGVGTSGMHNAGFDHAIETKGHYKFKSEPKQSDYNDNVYNADYCTTKGIKFMKESVNENIPFFLYMPYYLVHAPFEPKQKHVDHFSKKVSGSEHDHQKVIDVLAMIKSLDDSVGELMETLKKLGIDDNTIVIFTSDNGHYKVRESNMFSLPYRGNKGCVYEGGIRVPYIFKWNNKIKANTKSDSPIIHIDLLPTIAELTNLEMDKNHTLDGVSMKSVLLGKKAPKRDLPLIWFYTNYSGFNSKTKKFTSKWVNVIQLNDYKLIEDVETSTYELYNLKKDPYETTNIYDKKIDLAKSMIEKLEKAKSITKLPAPLKNPAYSPVSLN